MEYTITNENGMRATFINYACSLKNLLVPDNRGNLVDVVLGYDEEETYESGTNCFGALGFHCGLNDVSCHRNFDGELKDNKVIFTGVSDNTEGEFGGRVEYTVTYALTKYNELVITYKALTDTPAVLGFTNHSCFNLNGQDHTNILDHRFTMNTKKYAEKNIENVNTGKILDVKGSKLDYSETRYIEGDLDYEFILDNKGELAYVCSMMSKKTGIVLQCFTNEPVVRICTGNHVQEDKVRTGKGRKRYPKYGGVSIETFSRPSGIVTDTFPVKEIAPGETYKSKTVYKFLIR